MLPRITTGLSTSLDGFIPELTSAASAKFFDEFAARQGAVCLRESVLDLLTIHLVPVVLGRGWWRS